MNEDKSEFDVTGTISRINVRQRMTHLSVRVGGVKEQFTDIKFFRQLAGYERGERVRVTGRIGSEKLADYKETGRDGKQYDKWVVLLVGEKVESLGKQQGDLEGVDRAPRGGGGGSDDIPF